MQNEYFTQIIRNLDARIEICSTNFSGIRSDRDINSLSISEAKRLRDLAKAENEKMTDIAMVELYHIIGMGNLTMPQLSIFLKKVKKYLSYRPTVKFFSKNFTSLDDIPPIQNGTKYRLMKLGDFWLTTGNEDAAEDEAAIDDYEQEHRPIVKIGFDYFLNGKELKIHENQLGNLIAESKIIFGIQLNETALKEKILKRCSYGGIAWQGIDSEDYVHGVVKSNTVYLKLKKYISR